MTLDEAQRCLDVTVQSDVEKIREAFRRRAREVHPDRHPGIDPAERKRLEREFDRAREARDILVRHALDPLRTSAGPAPDAPAPTTRRAYRATNPTAPPRSPRSTPRTAPPTQRPPRAPGGPAPRVTMRFDEFVTWSDAAGFGAGLRSKFPRDWVRIVVWPTVAVAVLVVATEGLWVPLTL